MEARCFNRRNVIEYLYAKYYEILIRSLLHLKYAKLSYFCQIYLPVCFLQINIPLCKFIFIHYKISYHFDYDLNYRN